MLQIWAHYWRQIWGLIIRRKFGEYQADIPKLNFNINFNIESTYLTFDIQNICQSLVVTGHLRLPFSLLYATNSSSCLPSSFNLSSLSGSQHFRCFSGSFYLIVLFDPTVWYWTAKSGKFLFRQHFLRLLFTLKPKFQPKSNLDFPRYFLATHF